MLLAPHPCVFFSWHVRVCVQEERGGHTVAYFRNFLSGLWYIADDASVRRSSEAAATASRAHCLFYTLCGEGEA